VIIWKHFTAVHVYIQYYLGAATRPTSSKLRQTNNHQLIRELGMHQLLRVPNTFLLHSIACSGAEHTVTPRPSYTMMILSTILVEEHRTRPNDFQHVEMRAVIHPKGRLQVVF
jgi:hypothetical protein